MTAINSYFLIEPDWQFLISLRRKWRTTIQTSITGAEKKAALFTWARRTLSYTVSTTENSQTNYIKRKIFKNLHNVWGIPLWPDETTLNVEAVSGQAVLNVGSTSYRNFEIGARCIIFSSLSSYETGEIQSISSNSITLTGNLSSTWSSGISVYPILKAKIKEIQNIKNITSNIGIIQIRVEEIYDEDVTRSINTIDSYRVYRGMPVFFLEPNWANVVFQDILHPYKELVFFGKNFSESNYLETDLKLKANYIFQTKETITSVFNFFDNMKGRWKRFWVPSWQKDIVVTDSFLATDTTLIISDIEYTTYWESNDITGRYVFILFPDGTKKYMKILSAPTSTSILLDGVIGKACSTNELGSLLVSFLYLVRFDIDEIEIKYETDEIGLSALAFKTLGQETLPTTTTSSTSSSSTSSSSTSSSSTSSSTISTTSTQSSTTSTTTVTV